jgi:hypothetical protein
MSPLFFALMCRAYILISVAIVTLLALTFALMLIIDLVCEASVHEIPSTWRTECVSSGEKKRCSIQNTYLWYRIHIR